MVQNTVTIVLLPHPTTAAINKIITKTFTMQKCMEIVWTNRDDTVLLENLGVQESCLTSQIACFC